MNDTSIVHEVWPSPTRATATLRGRADELRIIDGLLHATRNGEGDALVVTGAAGLGVSAMLAAAQERAAAAGFTVLTTSGRVREAGLPFAAAHRLIRPIAGHLDRLRPRLAARLGDALIDGLAEALTDGLVGAGGRSGPGVWN